MISCEILRQIFSSCVSFRASLTLILRHPVMTRILPCKILAAFTAFHPHPCGHFLQKTNHYLSFSEHLRWHSSRGRHFFFVINFLAFLCLALFPLASQASSPDDESLPALSVPADAVPPPDIPASDEFISLFEKVELEELPPADEYYIDDSPINQILELLDEEDFKKQKEFLEKMKKKIIKSVGGIEIPNQKYAQEITHDYVARYLTKFGKESLYKILDNGEKYRLFVREEIKKRNLPPILEFLPVVESEYKATAKSRSGAKGLWQFMENSMRPFLKKDDWIDERLDPWKSTEAALSKLEDNYRVLKDWTLAIGAYNCGLGAMRRALGKSKEKTFWAVSEQKLIPEETINYVPKLLSIAEIIGNSEEYRISIPIPNEKIRYNDFAYVNTDSEISLEWLASELRLDFETLKSLNTELLKDTTPPYDYKLRLPEWLEKSAMDTLFPFL